MTKQNEAQNLGRAEKDFSHWQLPDMTIVEQAPKENIFGRMSPKRAPQEVEEAILPPTLEEIETIRAEAEAEGREQGHQQGYQDGLEKGRLTGLEQGHNEGFSQGLEQGLQQGLNDAKQQVEQFEHLMQQLTEPLALVDIEIEQSLVTLAMTLAKAVIGHELTTHPEHILTALRQGIDALPLKELGANVRLHPEDRALVEQLYGSAQLERNHWQLEVDPSLQRGECLVTNHRSTVDMALEHRINTVFAGLRQTDAQLEQLRQKEIAAQQETARQRQQRAEQEAAEQAAQLDAEIADESENDLPFQQEAQPETHTINQQKNQQTGQHNAEPSTAAAE
ncbi:flagellar assembly protein FliH [Shewanella sp. AS1]|uniref:flagellar assembly protein FliH n=1 Tax=Shewanella sp. AS1 TaxID=2907626 RepID=UPI001F35F9FE|nr:flagellar assembly protein FliH [Shewanella sp. AS1]MCE9680019.1 flagellar assembly protein FliH [Shewanella sp. AS1]